MKFITALILLLTLTAAGNRRDEKLVPYTWQFNGGMLATLSVPANYRRDETKSYVEGIVTHIEYGDGSVITMQLGGMYLVPMLQEEKYKMEVMEKRSDRTIRRGKIEGKGLCWREDNFQIKGVLFPPNIAFENVSCERAQEFEKALDSFVRTPGKK